MAITPSASPHLIRRLIEDFRLLLLLIKDYVKGRYRNISPLSGIVFFLAMAYLLVPFDLINDFIPGLGQIDDAAIFLASLYFLEKDLHRYRNWREAQNHIEPPRD